MKSDSRRPGPSRTILLVSAALLLLLAALYLGLNKTFVAPIAGAARDSDTPVGGIQATAVAANLPHGVDRDGRNSSERKIARSGAETVTPPQGDTRNVVAQLRPRAEAGDARAALLIHLKLYECANLQSIPQMEQAAEAFERAGASGSKYIADQQRIRKDCESSADLLSEQSTWLEKAADGGDRVAQLLYASNPGASFRSATDMLADPAGLERYKRKASNYMSALVKKGDTSAMMWYAGAYDSGVMAAKDPVRSYAYYRLVEMAAPGTISAESMRYHASKVPNGKVAEADALADKLYSDCCKN